MQQEIIIFMVNRPTIGIGVRLPDSLRCTQFLALPSGNRRAVSRLTRNRFSQGVFSSVWRLETRFWRPKNHSQGVAGNINGTFGNKGGAGGREFVAEDGGNIYPFLEAVGVLVGEPSF